MLITKSIIGTLLVMMYMYAQQVNQYLKANIKKSLNRMGAPFLTLTTFFY